MPKARRDSLKESVIQLYERQFGAKAIAKTLGISPDISRTMLIEAGVYQPGRLKRLGGFSVNEKGERVRRGLTSRQQVLKQIQRARKGKHRRTLKTKDPGPAAIRAHAALEE